MALKKVVSESEVNQIMADYKANGGTSGFSLAGIFGKAWAFAKGNPILGVLAALTILGIFMPSRRRKR